MTARRVLAVACLAFVIAAAAFLLLRSSDPGPGDPQGAAVEKITISSDAVGQDLPVTIVTPEGAGKGSPLLVFLHGRDGDEESELVDQMYSALDALGDKAPVIAFPYGGESSYWHDRGDGAWGTYVVDEVIPKVSEEAGTDPQRVAVGGISMGGYGAVELAAENPGRFCAVGGHSPAIWQTAGETAEGAFDDAEDFAAHDVIAQVASEPDAFTGQPLWLDSGDEDPFVPGDDAMIAALNAAGADLHTERPPGEHESDYWNSHWNEYLGFYADALADCRA